MLPIGEGDVSESPARSLEEIPFFRPEIGSEELAEVAATLHSGWLTSGPKVSQFEGEFAQAVRAAHAVGVSSCTAALHAVLAALGPIPGQGVLVPTMTFAATAAVVCHHGMVPILVDCDPVTLNMDLGDAGAKLEAGKQGAMPGTEGRQAAVVGVMPVHVGGLLMDVAAVKEFGRTHGLWVVEDAAHAFPAAWRSREDAPWVQCGQDTADASCFSFYANKTITAGEGGMAVTASAELAERIRRFSHHGLSQDSWDRQRSGGWDYRVLTAGYNYSLTDVAASIGLVQLRRSEELRQKRQRVAETYCRELADVEAVYLPARNTNVQHAWHLFPLRLELAQLTIDRNRFIDELKLMGIASSVHWRPLHLHPYYSELGWRPYHCPVATREWERLLSLPLFPSMRTDQVQRVADAVAQLCKRFKR